MIKVMVFDDNKGRLESLELLINQYDDMKCVGTFVNCEGIIEKAKALLPDVILMDIDMPGLNGIGGLKLIRKSMPDVMVIMQTVFEEEDKIFEAVKSGAHGYFLKKTSPLKLIEGIRDVMEGGAPMTPSVAKKVLEVFQNKTNSKIKNSTFDLTPRELEILSHLVKGSSYKMIADACGISWHTVNSHFKKIYEKLHVHSATEAISVALEQKII
ncbi:MAG: response regulator transcription factor [Bacteroidetes bacterium]|jgi:DNA-binding NarL/FixJ family response regulator|nr:response regulator transcription factor [Bacteroidota bacterium]